MNTTTEPNQSLTLQATATSKTATEIGQPSTLSGADQAHAHMCRTEAAAREVARRDTIRRGFVATYLDAVRAASSREVITPRTLRRDFGLNFDLCV